jgi:two-component system heavy metal sensor histidine kinase CusS
MKAASLTARLSLLFALSTVAVLLGLGWTLERLVEVHFREIDHHEIAGKLALVRNLLVKATTPASLATLPAELEAALVGHPGLALRVQAADGSLRFASVSGQVPPRMPVARPGGEAVEGVLWVRWQDGAHAFSGLIARVAIGVSEAPPDTVAIGLDISHHQAFLDEFRRILGLAMLLAAAAAAALGWAVTRAGLRPLRRITALAADLDASRLGDRLPEARVPAEIKALVIAFNAMLARLEASFQRLSDVSADMAHELRTPISNLTLQTQVALNAARDADQYREILYSSLEEYERLGRMIGDMLFLARADQGLLRPVTAILDLAAQVRDLFDYFEAWAEEQGVSLALTGSAYVRGDPSMLRRALSNLLSNAIRHTSAGQQVCVQLTDDKQWCRITIQNPGPTLSPEQLPRLFERFYRADPARGRQGVGSGPGTGLGLAIVKSIAEAHGGGIAVTSEAGRTCFVVTLPGAWRHTPRMAPAATAGT